MPDKEASPIDNQPQWMDIIDKVLPSDRDQNDPLLTLNADGLFINPALRLSKINAIYYSKDQASVAFDSVCDFIKASIDNHDVKVSNPFGSNLEEIPEGKDKLLDIYLGRSPGSKLAIAQSILGTMDDYTQTAFEHRANFDAWEPIINEQLEYYKDQIQVIDDQKD
ncbi:MAG: hypothetical protein H6793_02385 [Candidatus Nomurabacteria bacterium]|nr:hypothetical protein [Candidatus Saccharibacteria bacterium]USN95165.1 MAG: hypothetical protein H6793_02385 [Candidatus Nomurabacteria bacterium]